jgi:cobalt/nickel transport protein
MLAKIGCSAVALGVALIAPAVVQAHFQKLLPSTDIVPEQGDRTVTLSAVFTHPMEGGPTMAMGQPAQFGVLVNGKKTDLKASLTPREVDGKQAFEAAYAIKQPGNYIFYLEPAPYWESAEKHFLIHYTKVVVDFGSGEGWDQRVGLPVEIEPLTRPYGVWTGNLFQGLVRRDGKPLPFARIEIEWVNDGSVKAPADPFITQEVKADANGVFAYAMPRAGWWGFNALVSGTIKGPDGKPADAELGGTIWVKAVDMK